MKKLFSVVMALLMILPLSLLMVNAAELNTFTINISGPTSVNINQTYDYTVSVTDIDATNGGLKQATIDISFDTNIFELAGNIASSTVEGWQFDAFDTSAQSGYGNIQLIATSTDGLGTSQSGIISYTIPLKVKPTNYSLGSIQMRTAVGTPVATNAGYLSAKSSPLSISVVKNTYTGDVIAPQLSNRGPTQIILVNVNGYEYSIDNGATWSDSNAFSGLSLNTEYSFIQRVKQTETTYASPVSSVAKFSTTKYPGTPAPDPQVQSMTSNSVTLVPVEGCEYSIDIDGTYNWQTSNVFTGLSPVTTYKFVQRMKETSTTEAGSQPYGSVTVITPKIGGIAAPAAPIADTIDSTSIVLKVVSGCEYRCNGGAWQDSNVFTGLTPNTVYSFTQRYKSTSTSEASAESPSLNVSTVKGANTTVPSNPQSQTITPTSITLVPVEGYEYSKDSGTTWQSSNVFTGLSPATPYYFVQRIAETSTTNHSQNSGTVAIMTIKYTNNDTPLAPVLSTKTSNSISVVTREGYEYSINSGLTWQDTSTFTGLNPYQSYTIVQRIAETSTTYASAISSGLNVTTDKTPTSVPTLEIDSVTADTITVKSVTGAEYSLDGTSWQDSNVFSNLSPNQEYFIFIRIKETDTSAASNSTYTTVTTAKRENTTIPAAPTILSKSATIITLGIVDGYEYKVGQNGTWQQSNVFSGLTPNTSYTFYQRQAETSTTKASVDSYPKTETTEKITGDSTVAEPTLKSVTDTTIELNSVTGYEYRVGSTGAWQSSPLFTGLSPNTSYTFYQRKAETATTYASSVSSPLTVKTLRSAQTTTPAAPVLDSKTNTSITLVAVQGYVYSINDGASWQTSNVFTGLNPATTYTFVQKIAETETTLESAKSESLSVATNKNTTTAPAAPVIKDYTDVTVTIQTTSGVVYSIDGGTTWQSNAVFTGLTANTTYTIIAKKSETATTYESDPSSGTSVTTLKTAPAAPSAPVVTTTHNSATIEPTQGYQYSMDGINWQDSNIFTGLTPVTQYTFYQRVARTNDTSPSAASAPTVASTIKKTAPTPNAPTYATKTGVSITLNKITGNEYSIDGGNTWQDSNVFVGLSPVTQYSFVQRVKETADTYASDVSSPLVVKTDKKTNTAQIAAPVIDSTTLNSITVVEITNYEYSLDKNTWQTSNVFTGLRQGTQYTVYQRMAETDTTKASAASPGTLTSTKSEVRPATPDAPVLLDLTATSVYLLYIPGYEYSMDGIIWQYGIAFEGLTPDTTYLFYNRIAATDGMPASLTSAPLIVKTLKQSALPVIDPETTVKSPVVANITSTEIMLIGFGGYEYSKDGGLTYQSSNIFTGLTPNTEYLIVQRIAASSGSPASKASVIVNVTTLKSDQSVPDAPEIEGVKGTTITIKKVPNVEYSKDGGVTWQDSNVFENLQYNITYTFVNRYKENETSKASGPSAPTTYIIEFVCDHPETVELRSEASCIHDGYVRVTCTVCGETVREVVIPATGHTFDWKQVTAATCDKEGTEQLVCSRCGEVSDTRSTPKTEHVLGGWEQVDDQNEGRKCSVCGKVIEVRLINKTTETTTEQGGIPEGKVSAGLIIFIIILVIILLLIIAFVIWYIVREKKKKDESDAASESDV